MPVIYGAVDLVKNELRNAVVQNLGSAPASPVKGQIYFDSTANVLYWYSGTQWVAAQGGAGAVPSDTVTTAAIGDAGVPGSSTLYSRGDHKHGMPAFGAITLENVFGATKGDGSALTIARSDHTHGNPTHDAAAHSTIPLTALAVPTTSLNLNNQKIINQLDPTNPQDGATKNYVDLTTQGLDAKQSVKAASAGSNLTLSGTQTVDGIALVAGDRCLVKDQTTQSANGIYVVAAGAWARATDMDVWTEVPSAYTWVEQGTVNADTGWVCTADQGGTLGTTNITWTQFSGSGAISAGAGLTKTGSTVDVVAGDSTLTVAADSVIVNSSVMATVAALNAAVAGMAKKFAAALTGTASPEVVTHNLNTRDVQVTVLNGASPYTAVEVDWDATTVNTVTIRYNPNLGSGYRAVVVG